MPTIQIVYLVLAVLGAVVPWIFNVQFFVSSQGQGGVAAFVAAGFASPAAASLTVDLTIACIAFLVWMVSESRRIGIRHWWAFIALTFGVSFACACPTFLFVRDRRLRA